MPRRKPPNPLEPLLAPRPPPKRQRPPLSVRLPPGVLEELNAIAKAVKQPRNAVVVALIRYGIQAYCRSQGTPKGKRG
jgi:hypothetical protein